MINDVRNRTRFTVVEIQHFACELGQDADDPDEALEPGREEGVNIRYAFAELCCEFEFIPKITNCPSPSQTILILL